MEYKGIKEIAKTVRENLKKDLPGNKFSVRIETYSGGQSLHVSLMESDTKIFNKNARENIEKGYQVNQYYINDDINFTDEGKEILSKVNRISNSENYDNSDAMIDYFDVNYYFHLNIGRWDKPFRRTA